MKITFYGYNAFLIESGDKVIAIDPGGLFFYFFRFTTLFPKEEWGRITHIFVTHGDPDHYWHADRVAAASNAPVICNRTMSRDVNGETLMLGPRSKGLKFDTKFDNLRMMGVGETIELDGMTITGIKTTHGELVLRIGPFTTTVKPGPDERIGCGSMGFDITLGDQRVVNLGDTLLHKVEWQSIRNPDLLMIPIGGRVAHNTMDEDDALQAVEAIQPRRVIPCHYNCPALFSRQLNPADDQMFKQGVEERGAECIVLGAGESVSLDA